MYTFSSSSKMGLVTVVAADACLLARKLSNLAALKSIRAHAMTSLSMFLMTSLVSLSVGLLPIFLSSPFAMTPSVLMMEMSNVSNSKYIQTRPCV